MQKRDKNPHPPVKITFVGDANVGKTSLVERLVRNRFAETTNSTIGGAFIGVRFALTPGDRRRLYHIWDTAGQERYSSLIPLYVSGSQVIVIVYDITNRYSFKRISDHWLKYIRQNLRLDVDESLPMIYLLGNKRDLEAERRAVRTDEAKDFADANDMGFLEVSAKTGEGATEVFRNIAIHANNLIIQQGDALKLERAMLDDAGGASCCIGAVPAIPPSGWW